MVCVVLALLSLLPSTFLITFLIRYSIKCEAGGREALEGEGFLSDMCNIRWPPCQPKDSLYYSHVQDAIYYGSPQVHVNDN